MILIDQNDQYVSDFGVWLFQFDEWGGAHVSYDREQRGGGDLEEHPLPDVGHRGPGDAAFRVEHLLQQRSG